MGTSMRSALALVLVTGCAAGAATTTYRDTVLSTMKNRMGPVRECYATALVDDPTLAGRIAVQITIESSGRVLGAYEVEDAAAGSEFRALEPLPAPVAECILEVVESTMFPPPPQGEEPTFVYPMTFTPE
jgi:hypothetical protein